MRHNYPVPAATCATLNPNNFPLTGFDEGFDIHVYQKITLKCILKLEKRPHISEVFTLGVQYDIAHTERIN